MHIHMCMHIYTHMYTHTPIYTPRVIGALAYTLCVMPKGQETMVIQEGVGKKREQAKWAN